MCVRVCMHVCVGPETANPLKSSVVDLAGSVKSLCYTVAKNIHMESPSVKYSHLQFTSFSISDPTCDMGIMHLIYNFK